MVYAVTPALGKPAVPRFDTLLASLIRQPLLHFLLLGGLLFALYGFFAKDRADTNGTDTLVIDEQSLLAFLQYRRQSFQAEEAARELASLSGAALQEVIRQLAREEALYRTALAMGLDRNDLVIRQRLIQKMEFIAGGFADPRMVPTEQQIRRYFEQHPERYETPPSRTFTQVYFNSARRGRSQAEHLAKAKLTELNRQRTPFEDAGLHGDHFLYQRNCVACAPDQTASLFGSSFARQLFAPGLATDRWLGPFESEFGFHLVLLTDSKESGRATLEEVRPRVIEDVQRSLAEQTKQAAIEQIVSRYKIEVAYTSPGNPPEP